MKQIVTFLDGGFGEATTASWETEREMVQRKNCMTDATSTHFPTLIHHLPTCSYRIPQLCRLDGWECIFTSWLEVRGFYAKGGEENAKGLDPYSHPTRFGRSRNFKKFANQHSNLQFSTLLHHTIFITQCYYYLMKSRIAEIYLFHILIYTRALFHRQKSLEI